MNIKATFTNSWTDFTVDFGLILPPAIRVFADTTRFLPMILAEEILRPERQ
jgi:hypothetical protein